MTPYARRVDSNHPQIVKDLERTGATVQSMHTLGKDCPDILVGYHGVNYIFEIKSEGGYPTDGQIKWITHWQGQANVIFSTEDAYKIMGVI